MEPGELLAGRYRIAGFLGQGTMGEVYEAEDLELGERVAVKALRPDIARDERLLLRFKKEILLAHRVTHPNVCRTFDLVYHEVPSSEGGRRVFLTMELLRGETLAERLARTGRMSTGEALPIVRHIAAALDAAHTAGIVHRDLKTANVFLVSSPAGDRAVVTDFGLAWSDDPSASPSLTHAGELLGSPAYMAPEQVRGDASSSSTDVYALGVVLYEMVTGELPFLGESAFSTALKRLQEAPPSPRRLVPDLDPVWERVILRCLERKPEDRYSRGGDVAGALEPGQEVPVRRGPLRWIAAGALALLAVIAGLALLASRDKPPVALVTRPAVAVLGFDNLSRDRRVDYVGTALFQMLPTELGAAESLRLVPVEDIDRARQDLGLKGSASLSGKTLERLRARLGADFVVTGSYLVTAGGSARYDVAVQDTRSGETVASFSESGTEEGVLTALEALGARLRSRLGAGELPRPAVRAVRASLPETMETARLYSEGLASLRLFEAPRARDLLLQAAAAEPDNPLIHSALAEAWSALGHDGKARLAARRAFELSGSLRPEERQAIEASYRETSHEWETAIRIYRGLAESFPDNLDYGLRLATAQTAAGRSADAAATLARLRQLPPLLAQDPRIDLAEAVAAGLRSEYALQRDAARRAARRGAELQARLLVAEARLEEGRALHKLGEPSGAEEAFNQAQGLFEAAGDRRGVAKALRARGELKAVQAEIEGARTLYDEALALQREIGDERGAAETVRLLGNLYYDVRDDDRAAAFFEEALAAMTRLRNRRGTADVLHSRARLVTRQGDLAGARGLYERALVLQRETLYRQSEAKSLQGLALLDSMEGHLPSARRHYERALALQRGSGDRNGAATVLHNMAPLLFQLGDFAAARKARQEALATSRAIGDRVGVARGLRGLADLDRQEGDLAAARKLYDQALAAYREIGSREQEAAVQDEIAITLLLQGHPREALAMLEGPLAFCREMKARREEANVLADRGRALHALGNLDGARRDLEESLAVGREAGDLKTTAEALVGLGLVRGDQGDLVEARRLLDEALALYRSRGDPSGEASALSGLGKVLALQGHRETARSHHEQALAIRRRLGERLGVEESAKALASL
ncbi:MAG: eukaryotic-like serine/threonine-protein kinase [Acidobacteriota bacterium]|jgi:tetratricopeptide (TPR) repeat protein/TolB-like protein|nr:eukaryotic-like serine/threonine-protein kinase [Acidobacteriota bacterium]